MSWQKQQTWLKRGRGGFAAEPDAISDGSGAKRSRRVDNEFLPTLLDPAAVGITEFLPQPFHFAGFTGAIKSRFVDFIVHEVALDGSVAQLTTTDGDVPLDAVDEAARLSPAAKADMFATVMRAALPASVAEPLIAMVCRVDDGADVAGAPTSEAASMVFPAPAERAGRTAVHEAVRMYAPPGWSSDACAAAESPPPAAAADSSSACDDAPASAAQRTHIEVRRTARKQGNHRRGGGGGCGGGWPQSRPDFLRFVLHKRNHDTPAALAALCRATGLRDHLFAYAGVKDRRGCTSQFITAYRVTPQRLARVNTGGALGVAVGNFSYVPSCLRLGHLTGNRFTLVVRGVKLRGVGGGGAGGGRVCGAGAAGAVADDDDVGGGPLIASTQAAVGVSLAQWRAGGCRFVNYFGLQRFGHVDAPTHAVGLAMLRRDPARAVQLILAPRPSGGEHEEGAAARAYFAATRDAAGALARWPPQQHLEAAVLRELVARGGAEAPGAAACALRAVPPRMRSMYLHAWQSRLWNRLASLRLRLFGPRPVAGDLVAVADGAREEAAAAAAGGGGEAVEASDTEVGMAAGDEVGTAAGDAAGASAAVAGAGVAEAEAPFGDEDGDDDVAAAGTGVSASLVGVGPHTEPLPAVRLVTAGDVAAARYGLHDVLLPVPGVRTRYPALAGLDSVAVLALLQEDGLLLGPEPGAAGDAAQAGSDDVQARRAAASRRLRAFFGPSDRMMQLAGAYRHPVAASFDVSWSMHRYTSGEQQVAATDTDVLPPADRARLRSIPPPPPPADCLWLIRGGGGESAAPTTREDDGPAALPAAAQPVTATGQPPPPPLLALRLSFTLPRSCYATMLVREVMAAEDGGAAAE